MFLKDETCSPVVLNRVAVLFCIIFEPLKRWMLAVESAAGERFVWTSLFCVGSDMSAESWSSERWFCPGPLPPLKPHFKAFPLGRCGAGGAG